MKKIINKLNAVPETFKVTLFFLICSIIQKTISIISAPIFTRLMSVEAYGIFSIYQTWLFLITIITTFRLDYDVFNKGMEKYKNNQCEYISTMQTITSIFTLICTIIYILFKNTINRITGLTSTIILLMLLELFFTPAISFWTLGERYNFRYKKLLIITISMGLLNLIVGVLIVLNFENKALARILSCVIVQILFGMWFYIYNLKHSKNLFNLKYAKFALLFNIPLLPHYFASYVLTSSDRIMIQHMCGVADSGIYSIAYTIGLVLTMISSGVNNSLIPLQYKNLSEKKYSNLNKNLKYASVFIFIITIIFIAMIPEILKFMAPKEYIRGIYVIPPVAVSVFYIFLFNLMCNIEFYFDKNKFTMCISLAVAILNVVLNLIFINIYGFVAAGYTTVICYFMLTILHLTYSNYISKKRIGTHIYEYRFVVFLSIFLMLTALLIVVLYGKMIIRYTIVFLLAIILILNRKKVYFILKK